jgi:hypothetical protein
MKQIDLLDWLDETAVIRDLPPAECVQQREWLKTQLKRVMMELDHLEVSPLAISEALSFYVGQYSEKAQADILKDKG